MAKKRVLIFIVSYNAENTIDWVLDRIPKELYENPELELEVLVIDDCSKDRTFKKGLEYSYQNPQLPIRVLSNPSNQGYGGNQKLGYEFAIKNNFDFVALIHGDGQYAPEELPKLLQPLLAGECDALFGSRMLTPGGARSGGMPAYKFVGNKILTYFQNRLAGLQLSEWHSGYRIYSCKALAQVPFRWNSNYFDFDTDIIIQFALKGLKIGELPIPTYYGEEVCHVDGIRYARKAIWACIMARLQPLGVFYDLRFDMEPDNHEVYRPKFHFLSSHSMGLDYVKESRDLLILGCGSTELFAPFCENRTVDALDLKITDEHRAICKHTYEEDLDSFDFSKLPSERTFDTVLALDVIEHLRSPETFLDKLRANDNCADAEVIISTPNIGFFAIRLFLLLGRFAYGPKGILDWTHTRLFTFSSLRLLLEQRGFEILDQKGIPAPFPLALGDGKLGSLALKLHTFLVKLWPSLFAYQIMTRARPLPTTERLLEQTIRHSAEERLNVVN